MLEAQRLVLRKWWHGFGSDQVFQNVGRGDGEDVLFVSDLAYAIPSDRQHRTH